MMNVLFGFPILHHLKKQIIMTTNKVTVTADSLGNVISVSNNPEYGYIRVTQQANKIAEGGWLKLEKRSALIKGKLEDLKAAGFQKGDTLMGNILVKESLTPFNEENPDRDLKIAGTSGVVCRLDDQPIYRTSYYTENPYLEDEQISHNNKEEIKEGQSAFKALEELTKEPVTL